MMRQMRAQTKWIMLVTAAAFVLLMVTQDFDFTGGGLGASLAGGELGRVNGDAITYDEWIRVYRDMSAQQQRQSESLTNAQIRQMEDAAWEQVVAERLLQQEMERRGITVTEAEIRQAARTSPPPEFYQNEMFQTDGQFDIQKYHEFLSSPAADAQLLTQLELYYRDMIPRMKLFQQVVSGTYPPDSELWRQYQERNERATIRYIPIDPAAVVPDEAVSVSDEEIADFHARNSDDFQRPARASVKLIALDRQTTEADTAAARDHATALRQRILDGEDFAEIAQAESADTGSAREGGSLGTFNRGQMEPAFDEAVFSLPIGEVSEPVQTPFGFHLIRVDSREEDEATASHILVPIELREEAEEKLLTQADSLDVLGRSLPLDAIGEQLGLPVRTADLTPQLPSWPDVGNMQEGVDWAFDEITELGEVSPVFESPQAYYVLELVNRSPARALTLEEASPTIRAHLTREKKLERARTIARELVDQVRAGGALDQVAESRQLSIEEAGPFTRMDFVPGLGSANPAIGTAFGLEPGQISGVIEADGNLFIIELVERQPADREAWEEQKEMQRRLITAQVEQQRMERFVGSLREDADVVDNRATALQRGS